jgi:hypothetical protein
VGGAEGVWRLSGRVKTSLLIIPSRSYEVDKPGIRTGFANLVVASRKNTLGLHVMCPLSARFQPKLVCCNKF